MRLRPRSLAPVFFLLLPAVAAAQASKVGAVEKIAEGVWVAPTEATSNAAWFLAGDEVVAVDAGGDPATGKALLEKIRETTGGKAPRYLIVTHAHGDHGGGASAFAEAGAEVICHENAAAGLAALVVPPGKAKIGLMALSERLGLFGAPRRVAIYFLGPAHTASDLFVLLPDDKILFSGDVALGKRAPFMGSPDVNPRGWENVLARLAKLDVDKVVPGHGGVGNRDLIADSYGYVKRVNELATTLNLEKTNENKIEARLRRPDAGLGATAITPDLLANIRATMRALAAGPAVTPTPTKKPAAAKKKG